jgi:hypothetical protein
MSPLFPLLSLPLLLLVLLFVASYLDSQPTFMKHAYPQFGVDSLSPPELSIARTTYILDVLLLDGWRGIVLILPL